MGLVLPWERWKAISVGDGRRPRAVEEVAAEVRALPARSPFRLVGSALGAEWAAALFRQIGGRPGRFQAALSLEAIERRALLEEAVRAGCAAIEVRREGALDSGLATALERDAGALRRATTALRRARGLGIATVARLDLGRPGDDEGVFERAVALCRRALVAIPVIEASAPAAAGGTAPGRERPGGMDRRTIENGIRWTRARINRHLAIWRRALWPTGARELALRAGYALRRAGGSGLRGRYTATMSLLRRLDRSERARPRGRLLPTLPGTPPGPVPPPARRLRLRLRAAANERLAALFIAVEGALDARGARVLLARVRQALEAGYERVTIDFGGLEWVSADVVTRFLEENRARLAEIGRWTRLENVRGALEAVRAQLGEIEGLRLIELATAR